jgi:hypothetical protein
MNKKYPLPAKKKRNIHDDKDKLTTSEIFG